MTAVIEEKPSSHLLDVEKIRQEFPILKKLINQKPLVYLDNSATTQKPNEVIQALQHYYTSLNANIHRGVHWLSHQATDAYEHTRLSVQRLINAAHHEEIIFTRGTTESINLVAASWGSSVKAGDEIIVSALEHHSNLLPWQELCARTGAILRIIPINDQGELDLVAYQKLLSPKVRLVALTHISNVIGTVNPINTMIDWAHQYGSLVLIDGAQAVAHTPVNVQQLDCDFYVFSAHKMYGPTGVGVLYGKRQILENMPPYQLGGGMVNQVTYENATYAALPYRFEAGTPDIAGVVAFKAAIEFIQNIGLEAIHEHEKELLHTAEKLLETVEGVTMIGQAHQKAAALSFVMDNIHPHDIGTILDHEGIAVRVGHHCAMPLMQRFNIPATVRVSFAVYNTVAEVYALVTALQQVKRLFNHG
jgi:cysteine desulfurase/selenocysteine lyase